MQRFLILFFLSATVLIQAGYDAKKSDDPRKLKAIKEGLRQLKQLTGKPCRVALAHLVQLDDFYFENKNSSINIPNKRRTKICREN